MYVIVNELTETNKNVSQRNFEYVAQSLKEV